MVSSVFHVVLCQFVKEKTKSINTVLVNVVQSNVNCLCSNKSNFKFNNDRAGKYNPARCGSGSGRNIM